MNTLKPEFSLCAVVPTYRRWPYLLSTVDQLLNQSVVPDEIVVVDQTPEREIADTDRNNLGKLRLRHPRLIYHRQERPHVYAARNKAAQLAESDLLLYLDDDVELDRNLVKCHVDIMSDKNIDALVGYTVSKKEDGNIFTCPVDASSAVDFAFAFHAYAPERIERISYCCANHFCIRRSVLMEVGGWDEHILTYGDKDMGLRLAEAGMNIVYDPRPKLVHIGAPDGGTRLSDGKSGWRAWQRAVSYLYLAYRHLGGRRFWKYGVLRAMRHTILLRRNTLRPWTWPSELAGLVKAFVVARRWAGEGVLSPFVARDRTGSGKE